MIVTVDLQFIINDNSMDLQFYINNSNSGFTVLHIIFKIIV